MTLLFVEKALLFAVIPAKAGIQFTQKMDARLKTSGMTD
jgi:hypothetical protein